MHLYDIIIYHITLTNASIEPYHKCIMKYVLILGDGMADYPIKQLNDKTPLAVAKTPYMDTLAKTSLIGLVKTVPDGYKPGSDVANLGALGYDATKCYTGRSPLEALSIGIDMEDDDLAMRTNTVTLSDDPDFENKIMVDYSAGEITTKESTELIKYVNEKLGNDKFSFYPGISYRHCLIVKHAKPGEDLTPPHDISKQSINGHLPKGELGDELSELIKKSYEILKDHPINLKRIKEGKNPANAIWFWGEGTKPCIECFKDRYGKIGAMISAVDLLKGIAIGAGMKSIDIEGATGTLTTNFDGKAKAAIDALDSGIDFCMIHLEAPDECGHQGDLQGKIKAIELIDEKILGPIYEHLKSTKEDFSILVMPDHFTPISILTHSREPVPFMIYCSSKNLGSNSEYNEAVATSNGIYYEHPWDMTKKFLSL